MKDKFLGAWLVSEYVYNPDGAFAGIIHQRRTLRESGEGRVRIIQQCEPSDSLKLHPMDRFRGEWVFEIELEDRTRTYIGPDVIGNGTAWGEGAMLGTGIWPRFGYSFSSFAALPTPERQLTNGKFFTGGKLAANIAGIAVLDSGIEEFPQFEGPLWPGDIAKNWGGIRRVLASDGKIENEKEIFQRYSPFGWTTDSPHQNGWSEETHLSTMDTGIKIEGSRNGLDFIGTLSRTGWLSEWTTVYGQNTHVNGLEILDPIGKNLVSITKWSSGNRLKKIEIGFLTPNI